MSSKRIPLVQLKIVYTIYPAPGLGQGPYIFHKIFCCVCVGTHQCVLVLSQTLMDRADIPSGIIAALSWLTIIKSNLFPTCDTNKKMKGVFENVQ